MSSEDMGKRYRRPLAEVFAEVVRSTEKHGDQSHVPLGGGKMRNRLAAEGAKSRTDRAAREGTLTWEHIVREELEESFAESDPAKMREELIQTAATCLKAIEAIDANA